MDCARSVGLLAAAALVLMNKENFGSYKVDWYQFIISIIIFLAAFFGTRKYKIKPYINDYPLRIGRILALLVYKERDVSKRR